jgi:chromosome segregation ATPase
MEEIIKALIAVLTVMLAVGTPVVAYILRRLTCLEGEQEKRFKNEISTARVGKAAAEKERDEYRQKFEELQPLADKVPGLEEQVVTLCKQLKELQERVDAAEQRENEKQNEIERLTKDKKDLEKQNGDLFEANKVLQGERKVYREALTLLGLKIAEFDRNGTEPGEHEPPALETTEEKTNKEG